MATTKSPTISWSEIRTWTTCRKRHHWSYRRNIQARGVQRAPWLGTCGHVAIAAILNGFPWEPAVDEWHDIQLRTQKLWDEEIEEIGELVATVKQIIPRYLAQYPFDFRSVATERRFRVSLRGIRTRLDGYIDAIVEDKQNRLWLMDHKFPKQFRPREDLDLDGQLGIYHYACHKAGFPVVGIIYNQLLAKAPKRPELTKKGTMSRVDITSDWATYREALVYEGLDPADYLDMREKLADKKFFDRYFIYRPMSEINIFVEDVRQRVMDARRANSPIYMSPNAINCGMCDFRELCLAEVKGADVEHLIQLNYIPRGRRTEAAPREEEEYDV